MKRANYVLALGMVFLASCVAAVAAPSKAVFRDEAYFMDWQTPETADQVASYMAGKGYTVVDATELAKFMQDHITAADQSVVVMANDCFPETVVEPLPDPNDPARYIPNPGSLLRKYLASGGKVVCTAAWPGYYVAFSDGSRFDWGEAGARDMFGTYVGRWGGYNDINQTVVLADAGKTWGLTKGWTTTRATGVGDVDIVLATPSSRPDAAAGWVKNYVIGRPGAGLIYIYDYDFKDTAGKHANFGDEDLAAIDRVATYFPAVNTNPLFALSGTVKDETGAAASGVRVRVTGAAGTAVFRAATDGSFSVPVVAGDYRLETLPTETLEAGAPANVTVAAAPVTNVSLTVTRLPDLSLATADGVTWKLFDYVDEGNAESIAEHRADVAPAAPSYDDSSWSDVTVPGNTGNGDITAWPVGDNTFFWYRTRFQMPASFQAYKDRYLVIYNYNVDDSDWTYLNGHLLGSIENNAGGGRRYIINPEWVNWTGDNVLAVKVWEGGGDSGFTGGAPRIHVGSANFGVLTGKAFSSVGVPALAANVVLTAKNGGATYAAALGPDGSYSFNNVAAGDYTLSATGKQVQGTTPASLSISVPGAQISAAPDLTVSYVTTPNLPAVVDKAVYYDPNYSMGWVQDVTAQQIKDYFADKGYTEVDAAGLATFMSAHAQSKTPSVVVFANDIVPDTVVDVSSGAVVKDNLINNYMNNGGRVLMFADIPFYNIALSEGGNLAPNPGDGGSITILGFNASGGPRDIADTPVPTVYGSALGLTGTWKSQRPAQVDVVDVPLTMAKGGAASWIKFYPDSNGPGMFIRVSDWAIGGNAISDAELADARKLAELSGSIQGAGIGGATPPPAGTLGDLNDDGKVNILDVLTALRAAAGLTPLTAEQQAVADVNGDSKFNITDVVFMLRKAAGILDKFPGE